MCRYCSERCGLRCSMEKSQKMSEFFLFPHIFRGSFSSHNAFSICREEVMSRQRSFHCLCGAISEAFYAIESSNAGANLLGSTFNIQNSIPHKSQKTKVVSATNRVKEFRRGTAGVRESAKEGEIGLPEDLDIGLGAGCLGFEPRHAARTA